MKRPADDCQPIDLRNNFRFHCSKRRSVEPWPDAEVVDAVVDPPLGWNQPDEIRNHGNGRQKDGFTTAEFPLNAPRQHFSIEAPSESTLKAGPHDWFEDCRR